ncbi:MAG: copper amine oxidase N-terminal domain-containing protein [Clostridiales bacterium]|jgi:hypothetical protein|nr:copper amine oxidase N-terminal domain-containing protein [Clostridiales bacterium]
MKKLKTAARYALLTAVAVALFAGGAAAAPALTKVSAYLNGGLKITWNGSAYEPEDVYGKAYPPLTYEDRTYLPLRILAERLGVWIGWDEKTQTVSLRGANEFRNKADYAVTCLMVEDYDALSQIVHPTKGVTFSPYAYIEKNAVKLSAELVAGLGSDRSERVWGIRDGSGEPIRMDWQGYRGTFVMDRLYGEAPFIGFNDYLRQGSVVSNVSEVFSGSFVEYYFPGSEEYEGIDWSALRLVFEREGDKLYLVGIVHDQWTI